MGFRNLFGEERGVSPVIGVILMVAITVILAAVIGSFVLGIGSDVQAAPQASLQVDFTSGDVTHNGGDTLDWTEVRVVGDVSGEIVAEGSLPTGASSTTFQPGDTVTLSITSDNTVTFVHGPSGNVIFKAES